MLLAPLLVAASCAGWHADVVGAYRGRVESAGPKVIDTILSESADGLAGTYVLHEETRDVRGTLAFAGDDGCNVALFRWTDLYGTGIVRLRFYPEQHCFEGNWGVAAIRDDLPWTTCSRHPLTS